MKNCPFYWLDLFFVETVNSNILLKKLMHVYYLNGIVWGDKSSSLLEL